MVVTLDEARVLKIALKPEHKNRLILQAEFIQRYDSGIFPKIFNVFEHGYVMERLQQPFCNEIGGWMADIKQLLRENLWNIKETVVVKHNWHGTLYDAVMRRFIDVYQLNIIKGFTDKICERVSEQIFRLRELKGLTSCPIHGDPTFDNVMIRFGLPVIIDPLPWEESYIPPFKSVDLGKLLQSAWGYECALQDIHYSIKDFAGQHDYNMIRIFDGESKVDILAAKIFCLIHYVRLLPYQKIENQPTMFRILLEILNDLETNT